MATRATYFISSELFDNEMTCFYIHWDGYPEGAAEYFWKMHKVKNKRGGYAGQFIRANELAAFTLSHESHGDTEYRYTLNKDGQLTAWKFDFDKNTWDVFYQGAWHEFVNKYRDSNEKLYLFKREPSCNDLVLTLAEAKFYADIKMATAQRYADSGHIEPSERMARESSHIEKQISHFINTFSISPNELNKSNKVQGIKIVKLMPSNESAITISFTLNNKYIESLCSELIVNHFENNHCFLDLIKQDFKNLYEEVYGLGSC